jgi:outer membrane lipopolysaccharide assembly protein LptE/RlpB|tara:strand:- start:72 stop:617 length:546 start_codon:yes stop_codon:yes gene_type:complete
MVNQFLEMLMKRIILLTVLFLSACDFSTQETNGTLTLQATGKKIELLSIDWEKVDDSADFAKNYSEKKLSSLQEYKRMVTVFLNPMSEDRRIGEQLTSTEYVEMFIVTPGLLTMQIRIDKGEYWVMSRDTYKPKEKMISNALDSSDFSVSSLVLTDSERALLMSDYQAEIDETRFLLNSKF